VSASSPAQSVNASGHAKTPTALRLASQTNVSDTEAAPEIDPVQVLAETAALENYFQDGFGQEMNNVEGGENDDGEDEQEEVTSISDNEDSLIVDNPKTRPALAWADKFILETRRKGGRQTENSVLKLWKVCRKSFQNFLRSPSHFIYLDVGFRRNRFRPPARLDCRFKSYD
jgi:hypothetical protein